MSDAKHTLPDTDLPFDPEAHYGPHPHKAKREYCVTLYAEGWTCKQIAMHIGVTRQAVEGLLKREGVTLRPRGGNMGGHSRHRK